MFNLLLSRIDSKKLFYFTLISLLTNVLQAQWQPEVRLTNDTAASTLTYNFGWCVASSGDNVHVVWRDARDGNNEIYYKRSTDKGLSWGVDTRMTNDTGYSSSPCIAASGSVVHVAWLEKRDGNYEIYYKHSTNEGLSWSGDMRLTNDSAASYNVSIAVTGLQVHVVWNDTRNGVTEIYYKHSLDGGNTWSADTRLTNDPAVSSSPCIAISGSIVHVVWYDLRSGSSQIYYKRSPDSGINWETDTKITNEPSVNQTPAISVSGSIVHIVWFGHLPGVFGEIYYKRSTDGGMNWESERTLTNNSCNSLWPSIALQDSVVHVVWQDDRDGSPEVYYKRSKDFGLTWEADTVLTHNSGTSAERPSISVSGSIVHVVWLDTRERPSGEIYYRRKLMGEPTGIKNGDAKRQMNVSILQNYPNPFNLTTTFEYSIPHDAHVLLSVWDIFGRLVAMLVDENQQAGTHTLKFNMKNLVRGTYIYKLESGGISICNVMTLIK